MLVEDYLVAVVSLPAGVFNPYSGVKTSILVLDRVLARKTGHIAFFKMENDGFDLGAQRRPTDRNDLPQVQAELGDYLRRLRSGEPLDDFQPTLGLVVKKARVAEGGEYNLSGDRYRENNMQFSHFPLVPLGQVAEVIAGQSPPGRSYNNGGVGTPFYQGKTEFGQTFIGEPTKWTTDPRKFAEKGDILMSVRAPVGPVNLATQRVCIGRGLAAIQPDRTCMLTPYAFQVLIHMEDEITGNTGAAFASINKGQIESIKIPLPPLDVQQELVAEIEGYQKVIDGARAVVENYRPHIAVDPEWPTYSLGDLAENLDSRRVPVSKEHRKSGPFPYYGASGVVDYVDDYIFDEDVLLISEDGANLLARSTPIAFSVSGRSWVNNHAHVLRFRTMDTQKCVEYYLNSVSIREYVTGSAQPKLNQQALSSIQIPLPDDRAILQGLISELEAEQVIIEANRELIGRFEKKIHATINQVWG